MADGINIRNGTPRHAFSGLTAIKSDLRCEAHQNARIAANELPSNAGSRSAGLRRAREGRFFIRDAGSEYGDIYMIKKDVRVVTTITFFLTD